MPIDSPEPEPCVKLTESAMPVGPTPLVPDSLEARRQWVVQQRRDGVEGVMKAVTLALPLPPSFHDALRVPRAEHCVVADIRVPATGRDGFDVASWVQRMERLGASAFAVSVDPTVGGTSYEDLREAAQATSLPILCRDLVFDPLQVTMARAHGAAAIVLAPSIVPEREFRALYWQALDLGMDVVIEAASAHDLQACAKVRRGANDAHGGVRIVGIDGDAGNGGRHANYERLAPSIPDLAVRLAMTSVTSCEDIRALSRLGYEAFLIGDVLFDSEDLTDCMRAMAGSTTIE